MKIKVYANKKLGFGKYAHLTGNQVLAYDRSYSEWMYHNDNFDLAGNGWEAPTKRKDETRMEYIDHGGYTDDEWMEMGDFYGGPFY